ncbi:MAG: YIP1 family protein [Candidatus Thorarchaeota archaeon]|nr:YIP1 family protein [Candidatus Thorarchaeota archaeon]
MRRCVFCDSPVPADATVCPVCKESIAEETLERILPILKRPEAPEMRAMTPISRIWGVIRRPATTYRDIGRRPEMTGPMMIIMVNAALMALVFLTVSSKFTVNVNVNGTIVETNVLLSGYSTPFWGTALVSIIPNMLLGIIYLVFGSMFAHLAFKITGGTGNFRKTGSIVGYSMVPVIVVRLLAVVVIAAAMPGQNITSLNAWSQIVESIYTSSVWVIVDYMTTAAFFWVGFVLIFGIREAHDTSTLWAMVVSALCMIVLIWTFWQAH